jgi:hypothetical protein
MASQVEGRGGSIGRPGSKATAYAVVLRLDDAGRRARPCAGMVAGRRAPAGTPAPDGGWGRRGPPPRRPAGGPCHLGAPDPERGSSPRSTSSRPPRPALPGFLGPVTMLPRPVPAHSPRRLSSPYGEPFPVPQSDARRPPPAGAHRCPARSGDRGGRRGQPDVTDAPASLGKRGKPARRPSGLGIVEPMHENRLRRVLLRGALMIARDRGLSPHLFSVMRERERRRRPLARIAGRTVRNPPESHWRVSTLFSKSSYRAIRRTSPGAVERVHTRSDAKGEFSINFARHWRAQRVLPAAGAETGLRKGPRSKTPVP